MQHGGLHGRGPLPVQIWATLGLQELFWPSKNWRKYPHFCVSTLQEENPVVGFRMSISSHRSDIVTPTFKGAWCCFEKKQNKKLKSEVWSSGIGGVPRTLWSEIINKWLMPWQWEFLHEWNHNYERYIQIFEGTSKLYTPGTLKVQVVHEMFCKRKNLYVLLCYWSALSELSLGCIWPLK